MGRCSRNVPSLHGDQYSVKLHRQTSAYRVYTIPPDRDLRLTRRTNDDQGGFWWPHECHCLWQPRSLPPFPCSPSLPSIHYGCVTFIGVEAAGIPVAGYKIGTHASVSRSNPERQERPPCIGSADWILHGRHRHLVLVRPTSCLWHVQTGTCGRPPSLESVCVHCHHSQYLGCACRNYSWAFRQKTTTNKQKNSFTTTKCMLLVISRLDYYISVFIGLPADQIARLQRVHNNAARLWWQKEDEIT